MNFLRISQLFSVIIFIMADNCCAQDVGKPTDPSPIGCPFEISLSEIDKFVADINLKYANAENELLLSMQSISENAKVPGVAIGKQLVPSDIIKFNQLRHSLVQMNVEELKFGNFQRDVHVLAEMLQMSKMENFYELKVSDLTENDPRRFYVKLLEVLRSNQPRVFESPLVRSGIDCDPEAGLFFEESFNKSQIKKGIQNTKQVATLNEDIERLRLLYQVFYIIFNQGISDIRQTKWQGENPTVPDSVSAKVKSLGSGAYQIYTVLVPLISKNYPSERAIKAQYMAKYSSDVQSAFPTKK